MASLGAFTAFASNAAANAQLGAWGPVQNWPTQGKHMLLMPNGKVLMFPVGEKSYVWNPATNEFKHVPASFADIHCAGHVTLADGTPFVVGGVNVTPFIGIKVATTFNFRTETWETRSSMKYARWYPTVTTLADGRVLAANGTDENKAKVLIPEVYDPATNAWTELTGASRNQPLYSFMYQLPNGKVYDAAPKSSTAYLDVNGTGSWTPGPASGWDNSPAGCCSESGAMYGIGKILRSGGGDPAHGRTGVIDTTAASPAWREVESMAFPRRRHNNVIGADGSVYAIGGTRAADDVTQAVYEAERWDPATEQWDTMAAMSVPRLYHSAAILLPDGRIVAAGGDNPSSTAKLTAQIYSPPYLFKGSRPVITWAPATASYGTTFSVGVDVADIASVALIRTGAATHATDMNQRYLPLGFTQSGDGLTVTAPASGNVAPPGAYMLVVKDTNGVPSVAKWVQIGSDLPPPPSGAPTADFSASPTTGTAPLTVNFTDASAGAGPMMFEWDFQNDGVVDSTAQNPSFTYTTAGTYTVKLEVTNVAGADEETKLNYVSVGSAPPPGAPTAGFTATPTSGNAPLAVGFTDTSTGSPTKWEWDFQNDGVIDSTVQSPRFTYETAGTYTVRLRVDNASGGDDEVKTGYITVNAAPPPGTTLTFGPDADARVQEANPTTNYGASSLRADGGTDPDVESYLRFNVSGVSGPVAGAKLRLYATTDSANGPAVYTAGDSNWSETGLTWSNRPARSGSGTDDKGAIGINSWVEFDVTPLVSGNGTYTLVVATSSTDGLNFYSREATNTGLRPQLVVFQGDGTLPVAGFEASPMSGAAPLMVDFLDTSTGAIEAWEWDFQNDGIVDSTVQNPQFEYKASGTYSVKLTVRNATGSDSEVKINHITVSPATPPGTTLTFNPVADAKVKSSSPTKNYGTVADLQVRLQNSTTPHTYRSYLKFEVTGLSGAPRSAKLRLYVTDASSVGGVLYPVGNSWTETGLTWSNAPEISGSEIATLGPVTLNTWKEIDLGTAVAGNGTYSFALKEGTSSDSAYYSSREGASRPELVVTP